MASVALDFIPPDDTDIVALRIYEGGTSVGPFVQIERVTAVGVSPTYITHYTTALATSNTDWFAIAWENAGGVVSEMSQSVGGGTETLVDKIVKRVRERSPALDIRVVAQETEAAIQRYLGDTVNPYDPTLVVSYRALNGLVYLVLAHAMIVESMLASQSASATIGLVSFKRDSTLRNTADLDKLIKLANAELGINSSVVLELEEVQSRLMRATWAEQYASIPWVIVGHTG